MNDVLSMMTVDDLNMYYSGTHLSIQSKTQIKPFHIDHFENHDDGYIYAYGNSIGKTIKGQHVRRSSCKRVEDLILNIPTIGYVKTADSGVRWVELSPPARGYKKGLNLDRMNVNLGREGIWNVFNEKYRDFILESRTIIYKEIPVGTVVDHKFNPAHADFEYLEDYLNEEINRQSL